MARFLSTLLTILVFLAAVNPVFAAPNASINLDRSQRYVSLSFSGLQTVSKVNYTVTYDSNQLTRGFEGSIRPKNRTTRTSRRQILGTCSSSRCVYHKNPKNLHLEATFTLKNGQTASVAKTLP